MITSVIISSFSTHSSASGEDDIELSKVLSSLGAIEFASALSEEMAEASKTDNICNVLDRSLWLARLMPLVIGDGGFESGVVGTEGAFNNSDPVLSGDVARGLFPRSMGMEAFPTAGSTDEPDEKRRLAVLGGAVSAEGTVSGDEGCSDGAVALFDHGESSSIVGSIERGSIGEAEDPEIRAGSAPE